MRYKLLLLLLVFASSISAQKIDEICQNIKEAWKDSVRTAMYKSFESKSVMIDGQVMRLHWTVFGEEPVNGRSLYISLHGGGGAPSELNDSQWRNQWQLYQPKEGVYLCPRPPFNTWDLHFRPECDRFYEEIIHLMVAYYNVNPDKVYILGYSAGGDGVWRLAPRLADHWAAASMMAGHPGDVSLVNLRNLPFMVWCGSEDYAYDRNSKCAERIKELSSLHSGDPSGYIYEGHIVTGKGHWMDREDTLAIGWMSQYTRNPYPTKIVWRQEEVTHPHFYYLSCPPEEMSRGKEVRMHREGNELIIERCDYTSLCIGLSPNMGIDFKKKVKVYYKEKVVYNSKLKVSEEVMHKTLNERQDFSYIFPSEINIKLRDN